MNKQQSNQMASLRKKLLAAIAMLLVACIMTVSSTYAWFTLSTAPEVKGISTTVGANGNLEMALGYLQLDENGNVVMNTWLGGDPSSAEGTSMYKAGNTALGANVTWGNLVDLSTGYGLDKIKLYPSRLNSTGLTVNRTSPLQFPKYGADGRITEMSDDTLLGAYVDGAFATLPNGITPVGVNGIGTASSFTPRQYAVMGYKSDVPQNQALAKEQAKAAIKNYAGVLAGLAANEPQDADEVDPEQIAALNSLINTMLDANDFVSEALKAAVLVKVGSTEAVNDIVWAAVVAESEKADTTIKTLITWINDTATNMGGAAVTLPSGVNDVIANYDALNARLNNAKDALSAGTTWATVKDAVSAMLDSDDLKIGNYTVQEIMDDYTGVTDNGIIAELANQAFGGGVTINFQENSANGTDSVFVEMAQMVGPYDSNLKFPSDFEVGGVPLGAIENGFPVKVTASGNLLTAVSAAIAGEEAPGADANAAQALTDTYGYVIDLLFRTNATDSYLHLQTNATGRVYGENGTDDTMGSGSNMTFTSMVGFGEDKIKALAENVRVVFYDAQGTILGIAVLDVDNATTTASAVKMDLKLANYIVNSNGVVAINGFKADDENTGMKENVALCPLAANTKTGISALVYLDGDMVTNAEAALTDLIGTLNLQFSSSADLKPMDYSDLMGNGTTTSSTTAGGATETTTTTSVASEG